jgi:hypothetical protein
LASADAISQVGRKAAIGELRALIEAKTGRVWAREEIDAFFNSRGAIALHPVKEQPVQFGSDSATRKMDTARSRPRVPGKFSTGLCSGFL